MKTDLKLKKLLNEIHGMQIKEVNKIKKYSAIDRMALEGILNSGVIPTNQSKVLREFFSSRKITRINESVIKKVDQDMKYLSEGLIDWFKKKGEEAKAAFEKGWSSVKLIWKNFSDVVKEFIEKMKESFKKIKDWVMDKVKAFASKVAGIANEQFVSKFKEKHPHEHTDLKKEFQQLKQTSDHLTQYFVKNLEGGGVFEKELINGEVEPKGETDGIPEVEAEKGAEELKKESYEIYRSIFTSKQNLSELMNLQITESGHLTDKIKNPIVKQIVEFCVFMLKAILSPFSTIVSLAMKQILKNTMQTISKVAKALQGPGVFEFAIISLIVAELFEVVEDLLSNIFGFKNLLTTIMQFLGPIGLAPYAEGLHIAFHLGHIAVGSYALATVIYNLQKLFDKADTGGGGGEEPEVQTAGYNPEGSIKLKEILFTK